MCNEVNGMIIAEYTLDHPILQYTRETLPEITITVEDAYSSSDNQRQFIARISHHDFETVDAVLANDPTITNPETLHAAANNQLYRMELAGRGAEADILPLLVEVGGVQLEIEATSQGWLNRTRFPNREAFNRIHQFCVGQDIDFTLHRIWRTTNSNTEIGLQLTDAQQEALIAAIESGYLEIPRECSLSDLATELDITESATSERIRRAVKKVVTQVIDA